MAIPVPLKRPLPLRHIFGDRYTYTISVPNMYHSLGGGAVPDFEGSSRVGTGRRMGASNAGSARC